MLSFVLLCFSSTITKRIINDPIIVKDIFVAKEMSPVSK